MMTLTPARRDALKWLAKHNGDGLFDRNGVVLAAGESAPVMRGTWNALATDGFVEFYKPGGSKRGRIRLTSAGAREAGK